MNSRVRALNEESVRGEAEYVLYWSQTNRRAASNHALAHAVETANRLGLPVLFYEGLSCTYPFANDRLHTFILQGVSDTAHALSRLGIGYVFYARRRQTDPNDVLYRLADRAAIVISDDYPVFVAARHNNTVPRKIGVRYEAVDSSCIVPMRLLPKREWAAYTIRPKIYKLLPEYLRPVEMPEVVRRWEERAVDYRTDVRQDSLAELVRSCEVDHSVPPSSAYTGGSSIARNLLRHFLERNLRRYEALRNEPAAHATSDLSPYLHFGHISSMEVALAAQDYAAEHDLSAAAFLEELIVRRELAFNFVSTCHNFDSLDALPGWARATLASHDSDPRNPLYSADQMECAATHDTLWNATQQELLLRGKIHGYYRMYWGKKVIEWSATHEEALRFMIAMHDKYALDGRDPNTYSNVLWCFGLHDRPWPERPVFGQVRYMSLDGMKRKTGTAAYIREIEHLARTGQDLARIA